MTYSHYYGVTKEKINKLSLLLIGLAFAATAALSMLLPASAAHNPAIVETETVPCGETTISAAVTDPEGTHLVDNMRLVVSADGTTQNALIPTDGTEASISVGPFASDTTVFYRVFGGGERNYDDPLWNGFGGATFAADINAYGAANGFDFVVAGPEDPNQFVNWHELEVEGCSPEAKDECKQGGYAAFGFRNQGQCIRYVNTGQDSREE